MFKKRVSKKNLGGASDSDTTNTGGLVEQIKRSKSSKQRTNSFLIGGAGGGASGMKRAAVTRTDAPDPDEQGRYIPPSLTTDTIDDMIRDVDHQGDDRYRAVLPSNSSPTNVKHSHGYQCDEQPSSTAVAQEQYPQQRVLPPTQYQPQQTQYQQIQPQQVQQSQPNPQYQQRQKTDNDQRRNQRKSTRKQQKRAVAQSMSADTEESGALSEMTSQSFDATTDASSDDDDDDLSTIQTASTYSRVPPSRTQGTRRGVVAASVSSTVDSEQYLPDEAIWSEDYAVDYFVTRQRIAFMAIGVSAIQLMILIIQLMLCGVATVDVNWMIGPYPDAFSEWGGKNVYLMLNDQQYWRIISPVALHVGVLHLLANVFCQLETCAFFEREWGSCRWIILYLISGLGAVAASSVAAPDSISVVSSGALMGLYGAKLSQILGWSMFELQNEAYYESVRLDQLSGVMCSLAVTTSLSYCSYIDWAGQVGGLGAGFLGGMFIFSRPLRSMCAKFFWGFTGWLGLLGGGAALGYLLWFETNPDEDLADVCSYFRNLYPEGYECECVWN